MLPPSDPAADPGSGRSPPALTAAELDPVVAAATAEWIAARPDADFTGLTVSIDDLAGMQLGYTVGTTVTIDLDAAGWGWDVSGGAADSRMSLHAVVLHELGHVLGLEHGDDGVMQPSLHPGETRDLVAAAASTGSPSAGASEASGAAQSILELIGATLAQYVTGAISGDHEFTASDVNIGGVLTILAPTLRFESIVVSGTGESPIFSGTVAVSSASATLNVLSGTTTFTGSATNILGSYTLATQAGDRGLLRLAAQNLQIAISGFAAVAAAAVVLESQRSGTTTEVRVGARGATATLGAAADPRVQVSGASLAVLARKADTAASPTLAVIASGNAALVASTGITLTGANWRVAYNDLGDLSAAPVAVETGSGSVSVDFAANVRSVSGTGTVTVSTLGGVTGSFAVTAVSGQLNVQVSDATSAVTAGTASARLSSASGTFTINGAGLTGSAQGALSLEGLPGLSAQGTLDLQVDSAAAVPYFRLAGTGRLAIAAFLELSGTLQFERSGPDVGVTVTGTSTSASLSLASTGAITGSGTTRVALPVAVPGLTLDGTVTLAITPSSVSATGAVTLTTPVGEVSGPLITFTKDLARNELSVSGTGITLFLGNRGAAASSDAGFVLGSAAADAVIRSNGSYALRVSGNASLANVSSTTVAFSGGSFVAELNTTGADVTLGSSTVAADTSRFVGSGVTLTVAGFSASGTFAVQSFLSAGAREVLLAAVGVSAAAGPVQVTSADLLFLIASDGKLTLQATGAATIAGTTALTLHGSVGFKYNTRQARVTRELIVAGLVRVLDVQAASSSGAFARFGGEGLALGILGQELSGDFELLAGAGNVSVTITDAKLKLGGGLVRADALSAIGFQISAVGRDQRDRARLRQRRRQRAEHRRQRPCRRLARRRRGEQPRQGRRRQHELDRKPGCRRGDPLGRLHLRADGRGPRDGRRAERLTDARHGRERNGQRPAAARLRRDRREAHRSGHGPLRSDGRVRRDGVHRLARREHATDGGRLAVAARRPLRAADDRRRLRARRRWPRDDPGDVLVPAERHRPERAHLRRHLRRDAGDRRAVDHERRGRPADHRDRRRRLRLRHVVVRDGRGQREHHRRCRRPDAERGRPGARDPVRPRRVAALQALRQRPLAEHRRRRHDRGEPGLRDARRRLTRLCRHGPPHLLR